jgi:hypothetical protein
MTDDKGIFNMSRHIMSREGFGRRKPFLSAHQKQIRFFTRLAVAICAVLALALSWWLSRPGYHLH